MEEASLSLTAFESILRDELPHAEQAPVAERTGVPTQTAAPPWASQVTIRRGRSPFIQVPLFQRRRLTTHSSIVIMTLSSANATLVPPSLGGAALRPSAQPSYTSFGNALREDREFGPRRTHIRYPRCLDDILHPISSWSRCRPERDIRQISLPLTAFSQDLLTAPRMEPFPSEREAGSGKSNSTFRCCCWASRPPNAQEQNIHTALTSSPTSSMYLVLGFPRS
ncbi:hypothetical protein BJ912DRAFT_1146751 [Pholiota molesta]|nr:hypothetical protein BJ912DRAFT_1146751 [Pholiota molesta]